MTHLLEETPLSTWHQGASFGYNLCFVWSQEAKNDKEYEKMMMIVMITTYRELCPETILSTL